MKRRLRALARACHRALASLSLVASRPYLPAALKIAARYGFARPGADVDHAAWTVAWEEIVRRPILVHDGASRLLLQPGRNEQVYARGDYESRETAFCEAVVKPRMTVFDVGANIGVYTVLFGRLVGSEGAVHAFEPEEENFERLSLHVDLNRLRNVHCVQAGVCAVAGPVTLHVFPPGFTAWHSLRPLELPDPYHAGKTVTSQSALTVPGVTLDSYCAEHGITAVDLLKIDVEGAELEVLEGSVGLLASGAVERILFEVSKPQIDAFGRRAEEIFDWLDRHGYTCHALGAAAELGPAIRRPSGDWGNYVGLRR